MSRTLVISTSSPALSLALFEGAQLIAHDHRELGRGHAEALVPGIAALPGQGRADAIIVDVGPGSFTGIRVGIAAARALALAWGVPVHGVTSAHLAAAQAFAAHPLVAAVTVLLDAGRGQLICQRIHSDADAGPADTISPASVAPEAPAAPFAGAGCRLLPAGIGPILHDGQPDARFALQLPASARSLPPAAHYLRPPDAVLPL